MADKPIELPLRVRKNTGMSAWQLVVAGVLALLYSLSDILGPSGPLSAHLSALAVPLFVLCLLGFLYFVQRNPSELAIDNSGVTYVSRRTRLFIAWGDIDRVTTLEKTVRVELKGQPEDEGVQVPGALLKNPARLAETLRTGLARWGGPSARAGRSELPAAAGKAQVAQAMQRLLISMGGAVAFVVILVLAIIVVPAIKDDHLRTHGVRMLAAVERIYSGDCGRHGCIRKLEYAYTANRKIYHGIANIGDENDNNDTDYIYVKAHSVFPIAVDPAHPSVADLNIGDKVFRHDNLGRSLIMAGGVLLFVVALFSLFIVPVVLAVRKAQRSAAQTTTQSA